MCRLMTDVAVNLLSNPLHNKCNCNLKLNQVPRREGTRIRDVDAPRGVAGDGSPPRHQHTVHSEEDR